MFTGLVILSVFILMYDAGAQMDVDPSLRNQENTRRITFQVSTTGILASDTVFITGNDSVLGFWKPDQVPLKRIQRDLWQISIRLPVGTDIEYKFTRGDWAHEALAANGEIPGNFKLTVKSDTIVHHHIILWRDQSQKFTGSNVTGTVRYHRGLGYPGLKPRDIIVWLPPEYESDPDQRFPVIYMHDGQNIFDPGTSAFGVDWQVDETADSLIRKGLIKPVIVVGIYNTPDRSKEYAPGASGNLYMHFIVDTVKPMIDGAYRTEPGSLSTATGGSSQGALIAMMLFWEYPDIFSMTACLSPAFRFDTVDYIAAVKATSRSVSGAKIYLDIGTMGLDRRLKPQFDEMVSLLGEKGFEMNRQLFVFTDDGGEHSEKFWAHRFWRPLQFFWGDGINNSD
jgi:predicted alpha/beta superfamily hydrolase